MYLDELADSLEESTGRRFSTSTIWRTLRNSGYTMKKVWIAMYTCRFGLSVPTLRSSSLAKPLSAVRRNVRLLRTLSGPITLLVNSSLLMRVRVTGVLRIEAWRGPSKVNVLFAKHSSSVASGKPFRIIFLCSEIGLSIVFY